MAYEPTVWVNDSAPALNADNLNKLEAAVADASGDLSGRNLTFDNYGVPMTAPLATVIQDINDLMGMLSGQIQGLTSRVEALENAAE